jgi:hypothetical protein
VAYRYQFVVRDASGVTATSGYSPKSGNLPAGLSLTGAGLPPNRTSLSRLRLRTQLQCGHSSASLVVPAKIFAPYP